MAEEVVVQIWCDQCMKDTDKRTAGLPFVVGDVRVDLCPIHARPIVETQELLATYGRKVRVQKAARKAPDSSRPTPEPVPCPECGKTYAGVQGLGSHRQKIHGIPGATTRNRTAA